MDVTIDNARFVHPGQARGMPVACSQDAICPQQVGLPGKLVRVARGRGDSGLLALCFWPLGRRRDKRVTQRCDGLSLSSSEQCGSPRGGRR